MESNFFQKLVHKICIVAGDVLTIRALSCNNHYFDIADSDMYVNRNTRRVHCCVSTAKLLRAGATMLRYAYIVYLVLS